MNMTYRELAAEIANMDDKQKDSDVTVMVEGEYYSIRNQALKYSEKEYNDVLDPNYPFIIL